MTKIETTTLGTKEKIHPGDYANFPSANDTYGQTTGIPLRADSTAAETLGTDMASAQSVREQQATPLTDEEMLHSNDANSGSFITGLPIGNHFIKFMRLGNFDNRTGEMFHRGVPEHDAPLTRKDEYATSQDPQAAGKEVVNRLLALAEKKKNEYNIIRRYLGDEMLTKLYGYTVVSAPRKTIQQLYKAVPAEHLEKVPEAEITLMEVWELIDPGSAYMSMGPDRLREAYASPEVRERMAIFANHTAKLFFEQRMMIDICDDGGIRAREKESGKKVEVYNPEQIEQLVRDTEDQTLLAYPRNVALHEGGTILFDTYVVDYFPERYLPALKQMARDLDAGNLDAVISQYREWFGADSDDEGAAFARGLILLKKMGATFESIL